MKTKWAWNTLIIKSSKNNENESLIWIDLTSKSTKNNENMSRSLSVAHHA